MKPMVRLLSILVLALTAFFQARADKTPGAKWQPLGNSSDGIVEMMEKAAFVDMPYGELMNVVKSFPAADPVKCGRQAAARLYYWRAWVVLKESGESALPLLLKAEALTDTAAYPYDNIRLQLLRGHILQRKGEFDKAYFLLRKNLDRLHEIGDDYWEGRYTIVLGALMHDLDENVDALRHFYRGRDLLHGSGSDVCTMKNSINIANCEYIAGNKKKALGVIDDILADPYVTGDSIYLANVLVSRYAISDQTDKNSARKAYSIARRLGNSRLLMLSLPQLAKIAYAEGDYKLALRHFKEGLQYARRLNERAHEKEPLKGITDCYIAMGQTDSVAYYSGRLMALNDSIFDDEKVQSLRRAEHLSTIHSYEQALNEQKIKSRWRLIIICWLSVFIIVVLLLTLRLQQVARRKRQLDLQLEKEKSDKLELQNAQYFREIEAKEKQIASNTLLLAQKNNKLKQLADQIEALEKKGAIAADNGRSLKREISRQLSADDDWQYFKLKFEEVHPEFFDGLKRAYPGLSKTDLRICAYIRVGMSAKEMANTMSVLPETVNTSRYRIRKKMGLAQGDNLETILDAF